MQAILLGVGIAVILALLSALVGPHFVDWAQYRPQFEREASRVIGLPVHIAGAIDVRILPTPSFSVHEVEIGPAGQEPRLKLRDLSVELALGPLLHGTWQAADAHVAGLEIRVGLDANGRVNWPFLLVGLDPEQVSIARLTISDGRAVLTDAASGGSAVVEQISFDGDVRSLVGPVKGEGSFTLEGRKCGFGLTAARLDENDVTKVRFTLDLVGRPLSIEVDGSLGLSGGAPQFDGNLTVSRPAGAVDASGRGVAFVPWHASGHIKANPANVLVPQGEFQYGPEERALNLSGTADLRLGRTPRFDAVISGQQLNLDSLLDLSEPARHLPVAAARRLAENFLGPIRLPIPGDVGIAIDSVNVAGRPLEDVHGDLTASAKGWELQKLEFRAPGSAQVKTSGRLDAGPDGVTFEGAAAVEATDPNALISWLEGLEARPLPSAQGANGLFRASGDILLSSDHVVIDRLKAEFDRRTVEGRLDYAAGADQRPARLSADLKAADIDIDQTAAIISAAFAQTRVDLPAEVTLTADVGQATIAGVEARNAHVKLMLDANGLVLNRLSVADLAGAKVELDGRLDALHTTPRGALQLDVDAQRLDGVMALLSKLAPGLSDAIRPVSAGLTPLRAHAVLTMSGAGSGTDATTSTLDVQGSAGALQLRFATEAMGSPWKLDSLAVKADARVVADSGPGLAALVGLDRYVNADKGPATLRIAAQGSIGGNLRTDVSLSGGGVSASASGTTRLMGNGGPNAHLDVKASVADVGPAFRAAGSPDTGKLPLALTSRVEFRPENLILEDVAATFAGNPLKGRLEVALGSTPKFEGRLDASDVVVPTWAAVAIGFPLQPQGNPSRTASPEPFAPGWFGRWSGRVEFHAVHAALTPALVAQNARGVLRTGDGEIGLENVRADLAGGDLGADVTFRQSPDGLSAKARLELTRINAAALLPATGRPGVTGNLTLQADVQAAGRSPAALFGSLSGVGTVSLDRGRLARLDPGAFDAATRAVDRGLPIAPPKILGVVSPALDAGDLAVPHVDGALTVASGQLRLINVVAHGEGADVAMNGNLDLSSWMVDAQLTLTGPVGGAGLRPDILLALAGPAEAPNRTIDVSAFANWLLLRSLDHEVGRAEGTDTGAPHRSGPPQIPAPSPVQPSGGNPASSPIVDLRGERATGEPAASMPSAEQAPLLPPPIEIGRLPGDEHPQTRNRPPKPTRTPPQDAAASRPPPADPGSARWFLDRLFRPER